jgi:hypothetical protein
MNPIQRKANSVEMTNKNDHRGAEGGLRRLRRPQALVYAALAVGIAAGVPVSAGAASSHQTLAKPSALQTFNRQKGDTGVRRTAYGPMRTFTRTPSFAWSRVSGATRYEFELSTSKDFGSENGLVWSGKAGVVPTMAVPVALPWSTGEPGSASFYWRVRAVNASAVSGWSQPAPFRMGWAVPYGTGSVDSAGVPTQVTNTPAGTIRWTPIDGASAYQIWFTNPKPKVEHLVSTVTNVADLREFAGSLDPGSSVQWRVRAERRVYGETRNRLPALTYGAWSRTFTSYLPTASTSATQLQAVSDVVSTGHDARSHYLVPAFVFPNDGKSLHHVYVATDENCINIVHVGAVIAGNAYAPRSIGGGGPSMSMADGTPVTISESVLAKSIGGSGASGASPIPQDFLQNRAAVDLWDSDWSTGRYYWTVVPVEGGHDVVTPQDQCQSGFRAEFKKTSVEPQLSRGGRQFVTGLSPRGRLFSATTMHAAFYGSPLVAWTASPAAAGYDVEWSRMPNQWSSARGLRTFATSAILPLSPGTWWYRVRGINDSLPGNEEMRWTAPSRVRIVRPTFSVHGG